MEFWDIYDKDKKNDRPYNEKKTTGYLRMESIIFQCLA